MSPVEKRMHCHRRIGSSSQSHALPSRDPQGADLGILSRRQFLVDALLDNENATDLPWGNSTSWGIATSIGLGAQMHCGEHDYGYVCAGGAKEHDRGSCSASTLFGTEPNEWYGCRKSGATRGSACHWIVAEGSGPEEGNVWCRVSRIDNDAAHHCKDDPGQFCHVITVRAGRGTGTTLQVDENPADRNVKPLPPQQAGMFGGGLSPLIDATYVTEVRRHAIPPPRADCLPTLSYSNAPISM